MKIPGQQVFSELLEQAEAPLAVSQDLGCSDGATSAVFHTSLLHGEKETVPPLIGAKLNPR